MLRKHNHTPLSGAAMIAEIIAFGSEMQTPFRQDTNSLYLTEKLNELGVTVAFKTIVGDRRKDLVGVIKTASAAPTSLSSWAASGPPKTTTPARATQKHSHSVSSGTRSR